MANMWNSLRNNQSLKYFYIKFELFTKTNKFESVPLQSTFCDVSEDKYSDAHYGYLTNWIIL